MEWYKLIAIGFLSLLVSSVIFIIFGFIVIWFKQFIKK